MSRQQEPKQQGKRKKSAPKRPKPQPGSHLSGTEGTGTKHRVCLCPGRIDPKDAGTRLPKPDKRRKGQKRKSGEGKRGRGALPQMTTTLLRKFSGASGPLSN